MGRWALPMKNCSATLGPVTPAQLTAYAAIVRHGSAKAAATELGVSEAAISSHTSALRRELDDQLYKRAANGLVFTPGGLRLATRAVELLGLQDQTRQEVLAASQGRRVLRLATTSLFAEYAAPGLIELFSTRADDLQVELSVHSGDRFAELLSSRQADVAVGPNRNRPDERFRHRDFLKYQLILVVASKHELSGSRPPADSIARQPWLLGPSAVEPNGATAQLLRRFKVPESHQQVFQSHAAAIAEAHTGGGIAVVPEFRVQGDISSGMLHRLNVVGASASSLWTASSLAPVQSSAVALELMRFITTPRATQAMLSGSAANISHFRPSVHVTLWS